MRDSDGIRGDARLKRGGGACAPSPEAWSERGDAKEAAEKDARDPDGSADAGPRADVWCGEKWDGVRERESGGASADGFGEGGVGGGGGGGS